MANTEVLVQVIKRDGTKQNFEAKKITNAILKAGQATGEFDADAARKLTIRVLNIIQQLYSEVTPSVENIQDIVEDVLLTSNYHKTAKAYILYREQRSKI